MPAETGEKGPASLADGTPCPGCPATNPPTALYCWACRHRLFAWLGDPFGELEAPGLPAQAHQQPAATGAAAAPAGAAPVRRAGYPWGKLVVGGIAAWALWASLDHGMPAALAAVAILAVLWRWPRMGWGPFMAVLVPTIGVAGVVAFGLDRTEQRTRFRAELRAEATARAATPTARAAGPMATATAAARAAVRAFGPLDGTLDHNEGPRIPTQAAGVTLRDFVAEARFYNRYPLAGLQKDVGDWDYGFFFRETGDNQQYHLGIRSGPGAPQWGLELWDGGTHEVVSVGSLWGKLHTSPDGSNRVRVIARGGSGILLLNDDYLASLDLSRKLAPGDVRVATGLGPANKIGGKATRYEGFTVWSLPAAGG